MNQTTNSISSKILACKNCSTVDRDPILGWANKKDSCEIMIVGLAPGQTGAKINRKPLSTSASGTLLWILLKQADLDQRSIYLTNLIKCPLPNNRKPYDHEIKNCSIWLEKELEIKKPKILLGLGSVVLKELGDNVNFHQFFQRNGFNVVGIPHPASLLRSDEDSFYYQKTVTTLKKIKDLLEGKEEKTKKIWRW